MPRLLCRLEDRSHPTRSGMQQSMHALQGNTNTPSRASPKPWVPSAVIDDNSSAFARYAASHRAVMGSGPPSRASSSALSSQVRVLGQTAAFHLRAQCAFSSPAPGHRPAGPVNLILWFVHSEQEEQYIGKWLSPAVRDGVHAGRAAPK